MKIYLLQGYGDFDMPYTKSVWVSEFNSNVPDFPDDSDGIRAEEWLKNNGFKQVKSKIIKFGGNC